MTSNVHMLRNIEIHTLMRCENTNRDAWQIKDLAAQQKKLASDLAEVQAELARLKLQQEKP